MKNSYKNTFVALLLTLVIVIGGSFVVNGLNTNSNKKVYTSNSHLETKSSNKISQENKLSSDSSNKNEISGKEEIVIEDTSTAAAIEASNIGSDIIVDNSASIDNQAIQYFEKAEVKVDTMSDSIDKVKTEGKALFVKLVDFVFYDTEINGIKFKDLTSATQEKLVAIVNSIDRKIESKIPGYKETVTDYAGKTYTYLSEKLRQGITYIDAKISENVDPDKYTEVKEETSGVIDTIKESVSKAIDISKETLTTGKEKLKNWYEGWK